MRRQQQQQQRQEQGAAAAAAATTTNAAAAAAESGGGGSSGGGADGQAESSTTSSVAAEPAARSADDDGGDGRNVIGSEEQRAIATAAIVAEGRAAFAKLAALGKPNYSTWAPEQFNVKLADLGTACWTHKQFTDDVQTREYRCPEVILGAKYGTPADMWSLACTIFELACGDQLFDPRTGERYGKDEDHLALCIELLGRIPKKVWSRGKYTEEYFNSKGELRNIPAKKLKFWPLPALLSEKYEFDKTDAEAFAAFLTPMLDYQPSSRASAQQALDHPWLRGLLQDKATTVAKAAVAGPYSEPEPEPEPESLQPPLEPAAAVVAEANAEVQDMAGAKPETLTDDGSSGVAPGGKRPTTEAAPPDVETAATTEPD
eukprot:COSAG01_NODE_4101_length_5346_cov_7.892401_2_plen_374_part_00